MNISLIILCTLLSINISFSVKAENSDIYRPEIYLTHFLSYYIHPRRDAVIIKEAQNLAKNYRNYGGKVVFVDTEHFEWIVDITPDLRINNSVGFVNDAPESSRITVAGGYFGMCMTQTVSSLINKYYARNIFNPFWV